MYSVQMGRIFFTALWIIVTSAFWVCSGTVAAALEEKAVYRTIIDHVQSGKTCATLEKPFWIRLLATNAIDGYRVRFS